MNCDNASDVGLTVGACLDLMDKEGLTALSWGVFERTSVCGSLFGGKRSRDGPRR